MLKYRKLLTYKEKIVFVHDYSNLAGDEYANAILENAKAAGAEKADSRLVLIHATNTVVNKNVMKTYKVLAKKTSSKLSRTAVVGATGIQKVFISTIVKLFKLNVRSFDTRDDALEWLTS